jgi:hypothetical protein
MLKQLIHDKINEIFAEYQEANNIIGGDIDIFDTLQLEQIEADLEALVIRVGCYQKRGIDPYEFMPSWYIYTDSEGEAYSETFGQITEDQFFTKVSRRICFDDLYDTNVVKIYYKGKEVYYDGWQPGMKYEYKDLDGNTVWVGYFPEWDH